MKPDEKYMPSNYRKSDEDLKFVPFTAPSPLIGWNSMSLFDSSPINNIPSNMIMTPQMNSQLNLPSLGVNTPSQQSSPYPNNSITNNPNTMGYNQPMNTLTLPSQTIDINPSSMGYGEQLSAYYSPQSNTPTNQGVDTNPNSMGYGEQLSAYYNPQNNTSTNQGIDTNPSSMGYGEQLSAYYSPQSNTPTNQGVDTNPNSMGYGEQLSAYYNPQNNTSTNQGIDTNPSSMGYGEQLSSKYNPNTMTGTSMQNNNVNMTQEKANTKNTNPNLIDNPNSQQNKMVSEQFPSYNISDILHSYNNPISTNTTKNDMINATQPTPKSSTRNPDELLRDLNLNVDEDIDLIRCCKDDDMSKLYKEIENDCPGILSLLEAYNIPSPIAKLIVRRIIKITMRYCKK